MIQKYTERGLSTSLQDNTCYLKEILPVDKSFDLIERSVNIGERECAFYFVDGFAKDEVLQKMLTSFLALRKEDMPATALAFSRQAVPYGEVDLLVDFDSVIRYILSGVTCMFVDGYDQCIAIDCRSYPARNVGEPEKDKSLRGSRDGFVETIVFNTALIRRRIRDPRLVMEMLEVGDRTRSEVALCYLSDRVDESVLKKLQNRIQTLQTDALEMNQQTLAEGIFKRKWYDPFPKFKFTERPDTAAVCLLEGKVVILVDNSPSAMILPTPLLDMIEEANDYYFPTITNLYLKISRTLIAFATVFLTPLFLLFMQNPEFLPSSFDFVLLRDTVNIPLVWQLLILELAIDGMRLAALTTPGMLSTPLSVIAGIVLGEFSVASGWFNSEVMLYMSFVAVANYTQPNFELGYALKFMRILLLVLTAMFDLVGFCVGCVLTLGFLLLNHDVTGENILKKFKEK